MSPPGFAVVGRPNKGKSSIVATLSRDDSVYIDQRVGSTRTTQSFPMVVGDITQYILFDTPGMQRARTTLAWLQDQATDAASRPATVRRFYEEHRHDQRYSQECEMLEPILNGAGIIYVVDGSCPFGAEYEPEMEILRWTGNPSLALINPIHNQDYVRDWQNGLSQYFRTVRVFDAHHAEFRKQLDLLELFGHLDTNWRPALDSAVLALQREREDQHRAASESIAEMIVYAINYSVSQKLIEGMPQEPVKDALFQQYKSNLVRRERQSRKRVEELFYYNHLQRAEQTMPLAEADLFNLENWYLWGLGEKSLKRVATASGAIVGGGAGMVLDAATGGLLGGLGTLVSGAGGAVLGRYGATRYADDIAEWKVKGIPSAGSTLSYGPSPNPNFPFVLLGRALEHHRLLSRRTHAHRETLELNNPLLDFVSDADRKTLGRIFAYIRKSRNLPAQQSALAELVFKYAVAADA